MIYVMSDLHGEYEKFVDMLIKINFTEKDELYILGDVIDRGYNPLAIIEYIVCHKNIHLIIGNHEQMFIDYYETHDSHLWFLNGGQSTWNQIMQKDPLYEGYLYRYLKKLPYYYLYKNFILSHAGLYYPNNKNIWINEFLDMQDKDNLLWNRSNIDNEQQFQNYISIIGHTPTFSITNNSNILHRKGTIYIDCGATFNIGKLSCLCLDTMDEFYV